MKKTILKYIAAIVLIIVLVAISVIKTNVSAYRLDRDVDKLKEEYFATRDSVYLKQLDDSTRYYIDSILNLESHYTDVIDGLNKYHDSLQLALKAEKTKLANKVTPVQKKPVVKKKQTVKKSTPKIDPIVKIIHNSYSMRVEALPTDLTKYERRISLDEITINLSREFKISPDSVGKIIKSGG